MNPKRSAFEILYVFGAILCTGYVLSRFALLIQPVLAIDYSWWFELGMVVGQVLFQWTVLWRHPFHEKWRYALLVISVSFMGAIFLVPLLIFAAAQTITIPGALLYFFGVVGVMFVVHWFGVKYLKLPWHLSATWVLYRCLLLLYIGKFPWS